MTFLNKISVLSISLLLISMTVSVATFAQDCDCYNSTRNQGISLMQKKQYNKAISYFNAAADCPDKPASNDLASKIAECRAAIQNITEANRRTEEKVEKGGYMQVVDISFSNIDVKDKVLTPYGSTLYSQEIRYLQPKITYNGLTKSSRTVKLFWKVIKPNGSLFKFNNSPSGFTSCGDFLIIPGKSHEFYPLAWGDPEVSTFPAGNYIFELWYGDNVIFTKTFDILFKSGFATYLDIDGKSSSNYYEFSSKGGIKTIRVSTDSDSWEIKDAPEWCHINDKFSDKFTIECSESKSSLSRNKQIRVIAGDIERKITIYQDGYSETPFHKGAWRKILSNNFEDASKFYPDGKYKGQLSTTSIREGLGVYYWNNGESYWGGWQNGREDGYAIVITAAGEEIKNCKDCVVYVGAFQNNVKTGIGNCYDSEGNLIYTGRFSNNVPMGNYPATEGYEDYKFIYRDYSNGDIYLGEAKNGICDGQGILIYKNGDIWFGKWEKGERAGYGILIHHNGKSVKLGKWNNNRFSPF